MGYILHSRTQGQMKDITPSYGFSIRLIRSIPTNLSFVLNLGRQRYELLLFRKYGGENLAKEVESI